jgi:hypothetical protein
MSESEVSPEITPEVIAELPSDWVKNLPDELRDAPGLRPLKDGTIRTPAESRAALDNFAKLQGNMAESHVKLPTDDMSEEDKQASVDRILTIYKDKLRLVTEGEDTVPPEDHTGYQLPEGGAELDPAGLEDIAKFALEHKWGQQQFADYVARMVDGQNTSTENRSTWEREQDTKLTEKLGLAKDTRVDRVISALKQCGASEDYTDAIKAGKVDAEQVVVLDTLVAKMVEMGTEGSQFVQQVNSDARQKTPDEHRSTINDLRNKAKEMQKSSPEYRELTSQIQEHMKLALAAR